MEGGVVTGKLTALSEETKGHQHTREEHQHTIQQTNHCTPLPSALGQRLQTRHAVAMQCGVGLLLSTSRTPPHCEGHPFLLSGPQRWGGRWVIPPTLPHSGHGTWGLPGRSPAMATAYSPPYANGRGVWLQGGNAEQQATAHPEWRVECSTAHDERL